MVQNDVYARNPTREGSPPVLFLLMSGLVLTGWAALITWASLTDQLTRIPPLGVVGAVATGIAVPALLYIALGSVQRGVAYVGLRGLTGFHVWRLPAAIAFFWFGASGELPLMFVVLAGVGDLIAGLLALWVVTLRAPSRRQYLFVHLFGLADFIVAVGTGVTLTLLADPLMGAVQRFPLALIPFFGVALSGATHLMALHLIATRRTGV